MSSVNPFDAVLVVPERAHEHGIGCSGSGSQLVIVPAGLDDSETQVIKQNLDFESHAISSEQSDEVIRNAHRAPHRRVKRKYQVMRGNRPVLMPRHFIEPFDLVVVPARGRRTAQCNLSMESYISDDIDGDMMLSGGLEEKDWNRSAIDSDDDHDGDGIATKLWREAKREVRRLRRDMDIEIIRSCADDYLYHTSFKRHIFHVDKVRDGVKETIIRAEKLTTMLNRYYWRRLYDDLQRLEDVRGAPLSGMGISMTLRSDPDRSVYDDILKLKLCWNRFRTWLLRQPYFREVLQREECEDGTDNKGLHFNMAMFGVPEVGAKTFMVHFHVVLLDIPVPSDDVTPWWCPHGSHHSALACLRRQFKDYWHKCTGDSYQIEISAQSEQAKNYVCKHLFKSTMGGTLSDSITLFWASGRRVWQCNRAFHELIDQANQSLMSYLGPNEKCHYDGIYDLKDRNDKLFQADVSILISERLIVVINEDPPPGDDAHD